MNNDLLCPEAEENLVACALYDCNNFVLDVAPAEFNDEQLSHIWAAGQKLTNEGVYVDSEVVQFELGKQGVNVPLTRLAALLTREVFSGNAPIWAAEVRDKAQRRAAEEQLTKALRVLYTSNGTWKTDLTDVGTQLLNRVTPRPEAKRTERMGGWTAAELLACDFPEPIYAVPGIIPVGLTFLGGRPKVGKSWLALQCAIAVGTGGRVLDKQVAQGNVLYLALEDNGRRLKERSKKQGMPATAKIRFEPQWPRLNAGGFEALDAAIAEHHYTLVVIDTLGRLVGRARTDDYGDMTDLLGRLQDLALEHDMAILALDHHRKARLARWPTL